MIDLTGDISIISFRSSRFSTIIVLCSVAVLDVIELASKPIATLLKLAAGKLVNGFGASLNYKINL
jgi:hypothetical protein